MSLCTGFSLEKMAVVWTSLESISGFDPSLEMTIPRYLKFQLLLNVKIAENNGIFRVKS